MSEPENIRIDGDNFCLTEHNNDLFGTAYFEIRKADILAMAKKIVIPLDASELEGPVVSIFNISKNPGLNVSIRPDFDDESGKINIYLNPKVYDTYSIDILRNRIKITYLKYDNQAYFF